MKVCLFGGTFDPPHLGHLIIAQTIFEAEKKAVNKSDFCFAVSSKLVEYWNFAPRRINLKTAEEELVE